MEQSNRINFRKERDFSELLNATFGFLKQEFKPLLGILFKRLLPFLLLLGTLAGIMKSNIGDSLINPSDPFAMIGPLYIVQIIVAIFVFTYIQSIVFLYIKHYNSDSELNVNEYVSKNVFKYIFPLIGLGILNFIGVFFGTVLLIIPGIYLFVAWSVAVPTFVFEDESLSSSLIRSKELIKGNWWLAFISLIVIGVIFYVIALVFALPQIILAFTAVFTEDISGMYSTGSISLDIILGIIESFASLLYTLLFVFVSVLYYNLEERKESGGLMDQIDDLEADLNDDIAKENA